MRQRLGDALAALAFALAILAFAPLPVEAAADPNKVLHTYFPVAETGFDPAKVSDLYSGTIAEVIFERLLTYDYLARPAKLAPMAAEALPEVADEGRTYTFHIRKGIYFSDDPVFKGQKRELTAQDFVYTYLRFFDPKNRSPYAFMLEGIEGVDELAKQAEKTGNFDYDAKVSGLQALDRYTLRIKLKATDYSFPFKLAHGTYGAVAREVIEAYANDTMAHPVGTGPYRLKEWVRASKIVLEANPNYRGFTWDFAPSEEGDDALVKQMKGKAMPQVGRIEISIIDEPQSIWLAFQDGQLDAVNLPATFRDRALTSDGKLLPELEKQGIRYEQAVDPDLTYTSFNFRDPIVGGFSKEKLALRRAIVMAYDTAAEIHVLRKDLSVENEMPIPRGVVGYNPKYRSVDPYDPDLANRLLDRFGYKIGPDGWRTMPNGQPLVIHYATEAEGGSRDFNELWQRSLERIHVKVVFDISKFADNVKAARACKLMMWGAAWFADYPDGENFMQLLYGPNTGQNNNGCYESKSFDTLYEQARHMPDSPERNHLFLEMSRQMEVDGAWHIGVSRLRNELIRPWVQGFKSHPIIRATWPYLDLTPRQ